jgi:DNA methylase
MSTVPYWSDDQVSLYLGDCLDVLATFTSCSVDAVVTDPPAAIGFMGKDWDTNLGSRDRWIAWLTERMQQVARVLKPGGHALVWALPRTSGWTQIAVEDAELEVRDCIAHIFGQGFPKSRNVSKAMGREAAATREVVGEGARFGRGARQNRSRTEMGYRLSEVNPDGGVALVTAAATENAARWEGWETALKPGHEVWWLARKPLAGTVAANVLEYGTGALNIDGCRVGDGADRASGGLSQAASGAAAYGRRCTPEGRVRPDGGRWPPNVVLTHSADCQLVGTRKVKGITGGPGNHDGSVYGARSNQGAEVRDYADADGLETVEAWNCEPGCPVAELDRQSGVLADNSRQSPGAVSGGFHGGNPSRCVAWPRPDSAGGASRYFPVFRYQAKASPGERPRTADGHAHPTVKPVDLMRWLVRLVTPPGGLVLDPFAGSGTTAEACIIHGFRCILIEQDPVSCDLIRERLRKPIQPDLFGAEL